MIKYLLNLLFPEKCLICEKQIDQNKICNECWGKCTFITKPYCSICSHPFEYETDENSICGACVASKPLYNRAISIFKYDDYSKKLIHKFKYKDQLHILDYFTNLILNMGKEVLDQADIIIPIPIHKHKLLKRGYNQAALLAMQIAKKREISYYPQLLTKNTNTPPQAGLNKSQREKNIKNSFQLNSSLAKQIEGKRILLIDDVITTGSTISECCKILKKAKPGKIFVLSLTKRV